MWLNDADPRVAAVWSALRSLKTARALIAILEGWSPSVALFRKLTADTPRRSVDAAARFIALNRMSFSGKAHTTPIGGWGQAGQWKIGVEWRIDHVTANILSAAKMLSSREVKVTCAHFREALNSRYTLYLDPPYFHRGANMYPVFMIPAEHTELADRLRKHPKWVLSYDDCAEVHRMYKPWAKIDSLRVLYSTNIGANLPRKELLITRPSLG